MTATSADVIAFKAKFDGMSEVDTTSISAAIDLADLYLDPTDWDPNDYALARMLWAAHWLTLEQQRMSRGIGMSDLFKSSVKFGERSVTFAQRRLMVKPDGTSEAFLQLTPYGMLFLQIRARNFPAVMVV